MIPEELRFQLLALIIFRLTRQLITDGLPVAVPGKDLHGKFIDTNNLGNCYPVMAVPPVDFSITSNYNKRLQPVNIRCLTAMCICLRDDVFADSVRPVTVFLY